MAADRITQISIGGMRCIDEIKLDLGPFTVLIGENGSGKSTIVEGLELLRKVATEAPFVEKLYGPHEGTRLLRSGAGQLRLGARIEGAGPALLYEIHVLSDGQVCVLALIAIQQLRRRVPPSLIIIDEPEAHLHPGVVRRIAIGVAEASDEWPVMIATQSDALLDAVSGRPDALVHCRLDERRRTELARLDRAQLRDWLDEFRGVGELRREGMEDLAFPPAS